MRNLSYELRNKAINYKTLLKYGFTKKDDIYIYKYKICNEQFDVIVEVKDNNMTSRLIDLASEEEYVLVDIEESVRKVCWKSS